MKVIGIKPYPSYSVRIILAVLSVRLLVRVDPRGLDRVRIILAVLSVRLLVRVDPRGLDTINFAALGTHRNANLTNEKFNFQSIS